MPGILRPAGAKIQGRVTHMLAVRRSELAHRLVVHKFEAGHKLAAHKVGADCKLEAHMELVRRTVGQAEDSIGGPVERRQAELAERRQAGLAESKPVEQEQHIWKKTANLIPRTQKR